MSNINLAKKYPPSKPCSCEICLNFCQRPGWWTVEQATRVVDTGYANRMMLEISPEFTFGVLSPAFKGNEGSIAMQNFARQGCTFLRDNLCELFGTGLQPLECRFCHHTRRGLGGKCHSDLEKDWYSQKGQKLIIRWNEITRAFERQGLIIGVQPAEIQLSRNTLNGSFSSFNHHLKGNPDQAAEKGAG
jgi:hypothetical protein